MSPKSTLVHLEKKSPIKISVSGAHETSHCGFESLEKAELLGREIAEHGGVTLLGTATGFPLWAAKGAKEAGGIVIGFSPAANEREHVSVYRLPTEYMDVIVYTGFGIAGRDLLLMRASDAVIFGCGRVGTVHEFTIAFQEQKPMGIFQGPWDTDELLRDILKRDVERSHDTIVFDNDPRRLLEQVIKIVRERGSQL